MARARLLLRVILPSLVVIALALPRPLLHGQAAIEAEKGIEFGNKGGFPLKLDLARPKAPGGPFAALVFIHGGGWIGGSRSEFWPAVIQAAERGFVAVTIDYRLTSGPNGSQFPAQVYDAKCAVRWLRANQEHYRIDPDRIGAVGFSAGGYLALMLGLTTPFDGFDSDDGATAYASSVQTVVSLAGPVELSRSPAIDADILRRLLGGTPQEFPERYARASPLTYVRRGSPPILTVNGDRDLEVPLEQAELLDAKMKKVGAAHTLIIRKGAGHQNFRIENEIWDFLKKQLQAEAR